MLSRRSSLKPKSDTFDGDMPFSFFFGGMRYDGERVVGAVARGDMTPQRDHDSLLLSTEMIGTSEDWSRHIG